MFQEKLITKVWSGPARYLSDNEEEELVTFLHCATFGYPHTCAEVIELVRKIKESSSINVL